MSVLERLVEISKLDERPRQVIAGPFMAAVISDDWCGLSTVYARHTRGEDPIRDPGRLHLKTIGELAGLALSELPLEASVGMAAINAAVPKDTSKLMEKGAYAILAEKARDRNMTLVGHFPFAGRLKDICRRLWVLELDPQGDDLPSRKAEEVIPDSQVVGITASAFINHTMDGLLDLARGKYVAVLGPSTPLCADIFEFGVDLLAGAWPVDVPAVIQAISQGASFRMLSGIKKVSMEKT